MTCFSKQKYTIQYQEQKYSQVCEKQLVDGE